MSRLNNSVLSSNQKCLDDLAYNTLIQLRTIGSNVTNPNIPITSLAGRLTGQNIKFTDRQMYEDYKMRRKVEVLQYNGTNQHGQVNTKKQTFSYMNNVRGSSKTSQARLQSLANSSCEDTPILLPPTKSGIRDLSFPGYKLNKSIPFRTSL